MASEAWFEDLRLERHAFDIRQARRDGKVVYEWTGAITDPPPLRESGRLSRAQCLEIYRFMLMNRIMEQQLENLYKQGQVVGGVYFGLGQEGNSVASAYALDEADWMAPMIRNQGSLLVRGFAPRDVMMQYMAKAGSPTGGRDGTSHYGELGRRRMISPISMLGDLIPVMGGVCMGERLQGREVAAMTWIGDGGQSTGVFHEGVNFSAVQGLGLVLVVENNLWAYSTPLNQQVKVADLALRARGYGVPAVIVDGTDVLQVYDACRAAVERAHAGCGPTLIESKLMRMKGHAIHDAAAYVPPALLEFWRRRDPILRFERYLAQKAWLTPPAQQALVAEVEAFMLAERAAAEASPMPDPATALSGVYCDGCHDLRPRFERGAPALENAGPAHAAEAATQEASDAPHLR
ncbi:MAG: thiamine pyrophosphate-dependent dehydrogenase E1 component subunit alpha [Terriglobales bacterium]